MFREDQHVKWSEPSGLPAGAGRIRGIATAEQAVIGRSYIICPDVPLKNWAYSHIVVFECHLQLVEEQDELHAWMESVNRPRENDMDLTEADLEVMRA